MLNVDDELPGGARAVFLAEAACAFSASIPEIREDRLDA